jgi:predicted secreted hydrolase
MNNYGKFIWRLVLTSLLAFLTACGPAASSSAPVWNAVTLADSNQFARAAGPIDFTFPQDYGPHNDFQTEWWYFTGNLESPDGRSFGYQLTFFRRAVLPAAERMERTSPWAVEQVYLAHFTISDIDGKNFYQNEKISRGAAGLAGAKVDPWLQVWLEDWQVNQTEAGQFTLEAAAEDIHLSLDLTSLKDVVLQGDRGYSQKGSDPGNASYYTSLTRLQSSGSLTLNGTTFSVEGLSWMDHEYSTSALESGQVGWDWYSLQFDNGAELMLFQLRDLTGSVSAYSSGTWIAADGTTRPLKAEDFQIDVTATWSSPHSGAVYPAGWQVKIADLDLILQITPRMADQELRLSFTYWEGAVEFSGSQGGENLRGSGYIELTGYGQSLENAF